MDPWSNGDYSRHISEAIMLTERPPEVNPPSGRVPGQLLLAIPRSESIRRRHSGQNRVTGGSSRVCVSGDTYRPKGVSPLEASFGLLESSVLDVFLVIFLEFSEH